MERFAGEVVLGLVTESARLGGSDKMHKAYHDFAANEAFQGESCKHVQSKAPAEPSVAERSHNQILAHNLAILTITLSEGKLFRTFPCVKSPKERYPANAMVRQASMLILVE